MNTEKLRKHTDKLRMNTENLCLITDKLRLNTEFSIQLYSNLIRRNIRSNSERFSIFITFVSLGKGCGQRAAIKLGMVARRGQCLKVRTVIG